MSVINQMLRDLDARQASEQERAGLPPKLRTLPPAAQARAPQWKILVLGMGLGAAIAGGVASLLVGADRPLSPRPAAAPPHPPVPAATVVAPPPAVPPAPSFSTQASDVPAATADMKLDTDLTPPLAESKKVAEPKPAPATPVPAPKPSVAARPAPEMPAAKPPVPHAKEAPPSSPRAETAAEARIDKRPKGGGSGPAREQADGEYRKGMEMLKKGDAAAALTALSHALELDPGHAKARQALLAVLVGGRQWAQARDVAESGLALDPAQSGWAVILARLQFEQGDAGAAVATLEKYAAHAKSDAEYQGLFGYLLQKQQRPAEAIEHFRAALAQRPGEGRWWFGLAVALEGAGKAGEARDAYAKAREAGNLSADMATIVEQKLR